MKIRSDHSEDNNKKVSKKKRNWKGLLEKDLNLYSKLQLESVQPRCNFKLLAKTTTINSSKFNNSTNI